MFWIGIRTMNRITPTPPIVVYWRFRYARAPSCTAAEIDRIRSLPGDSASSDCEVKTPYTRAQAAHASATRTPWCVKKLDKKVLRGSSKFEARSSAGQHGKKGRRA